MASNASDHPDNSDLPNVNRPQTVIGVTLTFTFLAVTAIALRLWVRFRVKLWGWDDLLVLVGGMTSVSGDILVCLMPADGLGKHLWTLSASTLTRYFRHVYLSNIAYCCSAAFIKLAILFQYLRLFREAAPSTSTVHYRIARGITIFLIVLISMWGATSTLLAIFPCDPIEKNWFPRRSGKCFGWGSKVPDEFFIMFTGYSASNMFLDLLVLATPMPFLRTLRIAGKSRAGLVTLFTLGLVVCTMSAGRLISLCLNRAGTSPMPDMPFHTPIVYLFSILELNIAIIAASIPIFWPVISSMATNKIWVINEIEVRVENTSPDPSIFTNVDIDLTEHGRWKKYEDSKGEFSSTTNRLSIVTKSYERSATHNHRHKPSTVSSIGRTMGFDRGPRSSHESTRNLYHVPSIEHNKTQTPSAKDWFSDSAKHLSAGSMVSNATRADVPLEHVKKLQKAERR